MLSSKNKITQTVEGKDDFQKQQTPYGGCINGVPVETAPHLLVSGPTGRGKSLRALVPGAILWRGPRVIISSKTDFCREVVKREVHTRGPLFIMDLSGELDADLPWLEDVDYTRVTSDPTALIESDDDALEMASMLMQVGSIGAGGANGGGSNDAFWQTISAQPLATLLLAGKVSGGGIDWTQRAAGRTKGKSADDPAPSWVRAYDLIKDTSRHAADLFAKIDFEAKMRTSLTATMQSGLSPWLLTTVFGGSNGGKPFAPSMREGPDEPTLAIVSPGTGVAAGAAAAVVETIIRHWRRGVERGLDRVLLSIDEFANTCPLPRISTYLSEARGLGVACVLATQSLGSQLDEAYGEARANTIREVAPAVLILQGEPGSRELVENAAWWDGEEDAWTESIDARSEKTLSAQRVQRTSPQSLLPRSLEEARLLLYGQKGTMVDLPGIWDFG